MPTSAIFSRAWRRGCSPIAAIKRETVLAEKVAAGATITLLCSSACTDAKHCHRSLLKELIEEEAGRLQLDAKPHAVEDMDALGAPVTVHS